MPHAEPTAHFLDYKTPWASVGRVLSGCLLATFIMGGCQFMRPAVRTVQFSGRAPVYRGVYLKYKLAEPDLLGMATNGPLPPIALKGLPTAEERADAVARERVLALSQEKNAEAGGGSTTTHEITYQTQVVVRNEGVLNIDGTYRQIEQLYEEQPEDDPRMREFKALKDSLDAALRKAGYTEEQIKRFYVMNFSGFEPAPAPATPGIQGMAPAAADRPSLLTRQY